MYRRSRDYPSNYYHDPKLGHDFFAYTGRSDQCDNCGCQVGEAYNNPGKKGGRFDEPCREQPWRCDACGKMKPHCASTYGMPDVICGDCWKAIQESERAK